MIRVIEYLRVRSHKNQLCEDFESNIAHVFTRDGASLRFRGRRGVAYCPCCMRRRQIQVSFTLQNEFAVFSLENVPRNPFLSMSQKKR